MLRWMQDSICVSAGLTLAWGLSAVGFAAETPAVRPAAKPRTAVTGRATVDTPVRTGGTLSGIVPRRSPRISSNIIVRAQNDTPNEFEEQPPTVVVPTGVVPPPTPPESASGAENDPDALKRLKDRSAKARWDQIHQEWLRNRRNRTENPTPAARPAEPAAEQPSESTVSGNPFEANTPAGNEGATSAPADIPQSDEPLQQTNPEAPVTPAVPAGNGVTRPSMPANRVFLQSQQKPLDKLPTDEELTRMLNDDNGQRLPPPVRDPALMPKITDIIPSPKQRPDASGRPIPEQDEKKYVKLGDKVPYQPRAFPEFTYNFQASNVWSNPLYFEDPHLERYGHSLPPLMQTVSSTGLFALQLGGLPYQMAINHPSEQVYPLGWYLPGDYVPYRMRQIPLSLKATAVEAAVILGVGYATP